MRMQVLEYPRFVDFFGRERSIARARFSMWSIRPRTLTKGCVSTSFCGTGESLNPVKGTGEGGGGRWYAGEGGEKLSYGSGEAGDSVRFIVN